VKLKESDIGADVHYNTYRYNVADVDIAAWTFDHSSSQSSVSGMNNAVDVKLTASLTVIAVLMKLTAG